MTNTSLLISTVTDITSQQIHFTSFRYYE